MTLSVCIFAHNEERLLPRTIGAISEAAGGLRCKIHILVNGCTDNTLDVANTMASAERRLHVHELPIGDKANAWNDYVHRIAGDASCHIFLDGDIVPSKHAFEELHQALQASPQAYGAAALPATGRSRRAWATNLFMNHYISGNLYALSQAAIDAIREAEIAMPLGAKGEDGLLTYLLLTDLKAGRDDTHTNRIVVADKATFEFDSLAPGLRDLKTYHHRLHRYSERHFQKEIIYKMLKENGLLAMPETIYEIYTKEALSGLKPRRDAVNYLIDRHTLKCLRENPYTLRTSPNAL